MANGPAGASGPDRPIGLVFPGKSRAPRRTGRPTGRRGSRDPIPLILPGRVLMNPYIPLLVVVALAIAIPALLLARRTRKPVYGFLFAVPGLAWIAFAYAYYGSLVPMTLLAKSGLSAPADYLVHSSYFAFGSGFLSPVWKYGCPLVMAVTYFVHFRYLSKRMLETKEAEV